MDLFDDPVVRPSVKPKAEIVPPPQKTVIDLAEIAPDKREQVLANASIAGFEVKNQHLVEEARKTHKPKQALLMEFPENPPPEVEGMKPLFRMSRQRDLDILFCGLNIGSVFQDQVEASIKKKFLDPNRPEEIANSHFVVFVYLAIALPFGENDAMSTGWSLTFFCPREFERIMPKALREHLGIDIWWKQAGSRFDTIWYYVKKVNNEEEKEAAIREAKHKSNLAWALVNLGAPKPEIPKQTIEKWVEDYYEKHPDERPVSPSTSPQEASSPPAGAEAAQSPAKTEVSPSSESGKVIFAPEPAEDDPIGSTHPVAKEAYERENRKEQAQPKPSSIF